MFEDWPPVVVPVALVAVGIFLLFEKRGQRWARFMEWLGF